MDLKDINARLNAIEPALLQLGVDLTEARTHLGRSPSAACVQAGVAIEFLLRDLWRRLKLKGSPDKKQLEDLLTLTSKKMDEDGHPMPESIFSQIRQIQTLRNQAAHHWSVKQEDALYCLSKLADITGWYFVEIKPKLRAGVGDDDEGNKGPASITDGPATSSSRVKSSPPPGPPSARPQPVSESRVMPQLGPSQNERRPGERSVMAPSYATATSSSGLRPAVVPPLPTPIMGLLNFDTPAKNLVWWVIGATAGGSVGGNLGRLGGSVVLLASAVHAEDASKRVQELSLLIGAIAGAAVGTVLAVIGPVWGPSRNAALRGVLVGAMLGWFALDIWGWAGLPFERGSRDYSSIWGMAGGLVGMVAGIVGVSPWTNSVRGLLGAFLGGILLFADGVLLSQSWNTGACFLFGAMAGAAAEFLARHMAESRRDRSHWFLLAFGAWAAIEAVTTHDFRLLQALTLLTALGGLVGAIVHTVRKQLALGPRR